ncbi:MAG: Uma2 family endonuclease [Isosphaeraceae bacterium]
MLATTSSGSALDLDEVPPLPVRRFSVVEYRRMIELGLFDDDERFELLEGWIVPKMVRNPSHDVTIELTHEALRGFLPEGWRVRNQFATTTADSEPEPDLIVVRGVPRDYLDHHPGPLETALVIEVADSSLVRDRGVKRRLYARAGYPVYWIINLGTARVEVYTDPTGPDANPAYRLVLEFGVEDSVPLVIDGREVGRLPVRDLLP